MAARFRIPLFFFFVAGMIGLLLRWQMVSPLPNIVYGYFLHAHSHLMFLGWVGNSLLLAFLWRLINHEKRRPFLAIFWALQALLLGMMISFPVQGYGLYSIVFSTLHTLGVFVFAALFFRTIRNLKHASCWLASVALIFFIVSSAGPFSLGYIMASGQGKSQAYYFSVYYYLHFQYNGFFVFGILSMFFSMLEEHGVPFDAAAVIRVGKWIAFSCVPAYALSVLWAEPGWIFNVVGLLAAGAQLYAFWLMIRVLRPVADDVRRVFSRTPDLLLNVIAGCIVLKLMLQLLSAHPFVAALAYELRPLVIAYLHLVLAGIISLFLMVWYIEMRIVSQEWGRRLAISFSVSLAGSEIVLGLQPWWTTVMGDGWLTAPEWIFAFSVVMVLSIGGFALASLGNARQRQPVS